MPAVTVIAKIVAKAGRAEAVRREMQKLIEPTRSETGCLEYRLHRDNDDPAVLIFYENWESMECLDAHMRTEHFNNYIAAVDGLVAEKTVFRLTEI